MLKKNLTIQEFRIYIPRILCTHLLSYVSDEKLQKISKIEKIKFEEISDFESFKTSMIVWYRDDKNKRVGWEDKNARNLTIIDEASVALKDPKDLQIKQLIYSLKSGLKEDIEIISIYDTVLKERVIVDGVHRAVALYYFFLNDTKTLDNLLNSSNGIYIIDFISAAGAVLFPLDFLRLF